MNMIGNVKAKNPMLQIKVTALIEAELVTKLSGGCTNGFNYF